MKTISEIMKTKTLSKALTWDELANIYDESHSGRKARTLPMDSVFSWAKGQPDKFKVLEKGTIHRILKNLKS